MISLLPKCNDMTWLMSLLCTVYSACHFHQYFVSLVPPSMHKFLLVLNMTSNAHCSCCMGTRCGPDPPQYRVNCSRADRQPSRVGSTLCRPSGVVPHVSHPGHRFNLMSHRSWTTIRSSRPQCDGGRNHGQRSRAARTSPSGSASPSSLQKVKQYDQR